MVLTRNALARSSCYFWLVPVVYWPLIKRFAQQPAPAHCCHAFRVLPRYMAWWRTG